MSMKAPRGTEDLIDKSACAWQEMQAVARDVFGKYGYKYVETPIFEEQDVFVRGIGAATDVVDKEMFHVLSNDAMKKVVAGDTLKAAQNLALRPEGTAGVVRCAIEKNLATPGSQTSVAKLMYAGQMFRCERPQKGRLRQFHQIGAEVLGAQDAMVDAEMIVMLIRFFESVGIPRSSMKLLINSMGDDNCRPAYRQMVKKYIQEHASEMCEDCNRRAEVNPLRAFDCKIEADRQVMEGAPKITDFLCDECLEHYQTVKRYLDLAGIQYVEDPRLVRGLDYYTRTVFEVQVDSGLGSQNAIGGGGRYDKLVEVMGGKPTPGIGFALGYERTMLAIEAADKTLGTDDSTDVYVALVSDECKGYVFQIAQILRDAGLNVQQDYQGRSLKSQFKQADKFGAKIVVVVGPDEIAGGNVKLRQMDTHIETIVAIDSLVVEVELALQ